MDCVLTVLDNHVILAFNVVFSAVQTELAMNQVRKKRITLRDVARVANVSEKTVSNVIHDWPFVSDETRERVKQAVAETGYRPSHIARGLVTGRTRSVGIVVPDISNPFFSAAFRGCEDALTAGEYSAFLCNTDEDLEKEKYYLENLVDRGVDGLILWGLRSEEMVLRDHVGDEVPIVLVDGNTEAVPERFTSVRLENADASEQIVQHLISHGRRRIGHLMGPLHRATARERLRGYQQALTTARLPLNEMLIIEDSPSIAGGYNAALKLFEQYHSWERPDALFCYNDLMAIGALAALEEMNLTVPDQVAVVGFDDIGPAALVTPMLTTVAVPQYDIGLFAAEELLRRIETPDMPSRVVKYELELKIRHSCGTRGISHEERLEVLRQLATSAGVGLPAKPAAVRDESLPSG
jgi:LacI family transcriptional regulator